MKQLNEHEYVVTSHDDLLVAGHQYFGGVDDSDITPAWNSTLPSDYPVIVRFTGRGARDRPSYTWVAVKDRRDTLIDELTDLRGF